MSRSQTATQRQSAAGRVPSAWDMVGWAWERGGEGGGTSRWRLVARAVLANLFDAKALARWLAIVHDQKSRGLIDDMEGESLRAIRPYVHRAIDVGERVRQLIDHADWLETALTPKALDRLAAGKSVLVADLKPPPGNDSMRLLLRRTGTQSPEGELLLSLALQRSQDVQHKAIPIEVAAIAFSRCRVDGTACLAIGGVRGQRSSVQRVSQAELAQALQGWKPSVLLVSVMQELARAWGLRLVGLDPASHRLNSLSYRLLGRHRESAERIRMSYDALWKHFDASDGPDGWVVLPLQSDDKLAATALSPEKRERQARRADYWIRTRRLLRAQLREILLRPGREDRQPGVTQQMTDQAPLAVDDWSDLFAEEDEKEQFQRRVLQTGPLHLP